jgi:hypothetical protein
VYACTHRALTCRWRQWQKSSVLVGLPLGCPTQGQLVREESLNSCLSAWSLPAGLGDRGRRPMHVAGLGAEHAPVEMSTDVPVRVRVTQDWGLP